MATSDDSAHDDRNVWLSHIRAVLFLASISLVLSTHGLLDWTEAAMLGFTQIAAQTLKLAVAEPVPPSNEPVTVVTITPEAFEGEFGGKSPLGAESIARILSEIAGTPPHQPKLIAIDLDISPTIEQLQAPDEQQTCDPDKLADTPVDKVLRKITETVPVVLLIPDRETNEAGVRAECWRRKVCRMNAQSQRPRIAFAAPTLTVQGGMLLKYPDLLKDTDHRCGQGDDRFPTLGAVAWEIYDFYYKTCQALPLPKGAKTTEDYCLIPSTEPWPTNWKAVAQRATRYGKERLNFTQTANLRGVPVEDVVRDHKLLQDRVVFFGGGDYGTSDVFVTPTLDTPSMPGVHAHAMVFLSLLQPLRESPWFEVLVDISVGLVVAYFLHDSIHALRERDVWQKRPVQRRFLLIVWPVWIAIGYGGFALFLASIGLIRVAPLSLIILSAVLLVLALLTWYFSRVHMEKPIRRAARSGSLSLALFFALFGVIAVLLVIFQEFFPNVNRWFNPAAVVLGLLIHAYVDSATPDVANPTSGSSWARVIFFPRLSGLPEGGVYTKGDKYLQLGLNVFWIGVLLWALWILFRAH